MKNFSQFVDFLYGIITHRLVFHKSYDIHKTYCSLELLGVLMIKRKQILQHYYNWGQDMAQIHECRDELKNTPN